MMSWDAAAKICQIVIFERIAQWTPMSKPRAASLTEADLRTIDECILSNITPQFRKTAKVVALTLRALGDRFPELTDATYCDRIKHLAAAGLIEAAGNLNRMRFSEVRLPNRERN